FLPLGESRMLLGTNLLPNHHETTILGFIERSFWPHGRGIGQGTAKRLNGFRLVASPPKTFPVPKTPGGIFRVHCLSSLKHWLHRAQQLLRGCLVALFRPFDVVSPDFRLHFLGRYLELLASQSPEFFNKNRIVAGPIGKPDE